MLPAPQQGLPLCNAYTISLHLKKQCVGQRDSKAVVSYLTATSLPCMILHSAEKLQGAGLGVARIFSPASPPWPHVNLVLVQAGMSVLASNNIVSSITQSCVFKGAKGPRGIFVDGVYVGYYQDWQF